jgi:hypothetical protein
VSGSIGLGQSFGARAIASGGAAPRRKPLRPLARDKLGWQCTRTRGNTASTQRHLPKNAPREGDFTRGRQGSNGSIGRARGSFLIAEVDERHVASRAAQVNSLRSSGGLAWVRESEPG